MGEERLGHWYPDGHQHVEFFYDDQSGHAYKWNNHTGDCEYFTILCQTEAGNEYYRRTCNYEEALYCWRKISEAIDEQEKEKRAYEWAEYYEERDYDTVTAIKLANDKVYRNK